MNHTSNYQLSQWEKSDKVQMEDFNADNAKIDAGLKAEADARAALAATVSAHGSAIAKLGDCQIYTTSYTGNGTCGEANAKTLYFPYPPKLVVVAAPNGAFMLMVYGNPAALFPTSAPPSRQAFLTWSGNSISWYGNYASGHMNENGETYHVVALCSKS